MASSVLVALARRDSNVEGILQHVNSWSVTTRNDIDQIEELNRYLDSWLAPYISELTFKVEKKDKHFSALIQEVRATDASLGLIRQNLLKPNAVTSSANKN